MLQNKTYPNGQTAAIYGIAAPLVNACRPPGEWQTYEIIFHGPKQTADGKMQSGSITVLHNGVLVQDHTEIKGEATRAANFSGVAEQGPLILQDHGHAVRYRNIWLRQAVDVAAEVTRRTPVVMTLTEYTVLALSSLFVIVDPIAVVPAFIAMTPNDPPKSKLRMANIACFVAAEC